MPLVQRPQLPQDLSNKAFLIYLDELVEWRRERFLRWLGTETTLDLEASNQCEEE